MIRFLPLFIFTFFTFIFTICPLFQSLSSAESQPTVGRNAASKYFSQGQKQQPESQVQYPPKRSASPPASNTNPQGSKEESLDQVSNESSDGASTPMGRSPETTMNSDESEARDKEAPAGEQKRKFKQHKPINHIFMVHLGKALYSQSYQWKGDGRKDGVGMASYGLTYLMTDWNGMDLNVRVDFNEYNIESEQLIKMSILGLLSLPKARDYFPLYIGLGAGPGIFFSQVANESNLSFDYQLLIGLRFNDLFDSTGLFLEFGMKNHLHLLSDGQFNGTYLTGGMVFNF